MKSRFGYNPTRFNQMVAKHGGVEAARQLLYKACTEIAARLAALLPERGPEVEVRTFHAVGWRLVGCRPGFGWPMARRRPGPGRMSA